MTKPSLLCVIAAAALLCFFSCPLRAQVEIERVGLCSSWKEFALSFGLHGTSRNIRNTVSLSADMDALFSGRQKIPGVKLTYLHQNILSAGRFTSSDAYYSLYAGGGGVAGYVTDGQGSIHSPMAGLAAEFGILGSFPSSGFDVALAFKAEFALLLTPSEDYAPKRLGWYRNGLRRAYLPEIIIYYRF